MHLDFELYPSLFILKHLVIQVVKKGSHLVSFKLEFHAVEAK
jgi:hypothetical protein